MKIILSPFKVTAIVCTLFINTSALAEKRMHRQPPPEAFEACEDKAEGDAVSVITPRGDTLQATCKLMTEQLVAVPDKGQGHEHPSRKGEEE